TPPESTAPAAGKSSSAGRPRHRRTPATATSSPTAASGHVRTADFADAAASSAAAARKHAISPAGWTRSRNGSGAGATGGPGAAAKSGAGSNAGGASPGGPAAGERRGSSPPAAAEGGGALAPGSGVTVYQLPHDGHLPLAPTARSGAWASRRQYGHRARIDILTPRRGT